MRRTRKMFKDYGKREPTAERRRSLAIHSNRVKPDVEFAELGNGKPDSLWPRPS